MRAFWKSAANGTLHAPVSGEMVDLSAVKDKAFSLGVLGPGVAFVPATDTVTAPCDGLLTMVANTRHAFGLTTPDGAEVLVHIGMDTVQLAGVGLTVLTPAGTRVRAGQPIIQIDRAELTGRGVDLTTPMVVTNASSFNVEIRRAFGPVEMGEEVAGIKQQ